jgi:hypothetical protein
MGPPRLGIQERLFPAGAANFMRRHPLAGKMFNPMTAGGYLLFELDGAYPVFIDGRSIALYGVDFTRMVAYADLQTIDRILREWDIGFAVLRTTNALFNAFQARPGWSLVYFDDTDLIAVRDRDQNELAEAHGYRAIHPARWPADLDAWSRDPALLEAATREAERAVSEAPRAAIPKVLRAATAIAAGDFGLAGELIDKARADDPRSIPAAGARLLLCLRQDDRACACEASQRVLELEPGNAYALRVRATERCAL